MNTADLALAREAVATHIFLCEDRLNHQEAYALLDEAMNVAYEVGRSAGKSDIAGPMKAGNRRALRELAEQYRRADGTLDLPKPGSQYGARLDAERSEAMKAAQ